jgi:hypothetical protein
MSKIICDLRLKTRIFAIFLQLSDKIVIAYIEPLLYLTITGTVSARFSLITLVNSDVDGFSVPKTLHPNQKIEVYCPSWSR